MISQQDKNLEAHLLTLLERCTKLPDECLTRLAKTPEAQDFVARLAKENHTNFGSTLQNIILSNLLVFFPILEKTYQASRFQHGVQLAKAQQEAADAKLAQELAVGEKEGGRAAKRRRMSDKTNDHSGVSFGSAFDSAISLEGSSGGGGPAGRMSRGSSASSGESRAGSRSTSPEEEVHVEQHSSVPVETGESSRMAATRSTDADATNVSLFLNDEDFELAIITAAPPALARVKETWNYLGDPRDYRRANFHCEREQDMVLSYVIKFDFFILGPALVEHLSQRVRFMSQSDHEPSMAELARLATSQETAPFQRFQALKGMTCAGKHDWIQRVYGEILLWETVQAEVERRSEAILLTRRSSKLSEHQKILKNMAREAAEREAYQKKKDIDRIIAQFERHFYAGLKWRNVAKDFKGSGIIIAFIVAGFCASLVGSTLTEYQRRCLGNLSGSLPKLGRLVQAMGENALQVYCEQGCLPPDRFVNVEELVKEHTGFDVNDDV